MRLTCTICLTEPVNCRNFNNRYFLVSWIWIPIFLPRNFFYSNFRNRIYVVPNFAPVSGCKFVISRYNIPTKYRHELNNYVHRKLYNNARSVHHTERFMVIEICRNMLLRGKKTTLEHARDELSFHILRVTYNRVKVSELPCMPFKRS